MQTTQQSNIIQRGNTTVIFNGGDPLGDCPTSWDEAHAWQDRVNANRTPDQVKWSWDCGFKLDFDGRLGKRMEVTSRFYPPKTHYGATWDGSTAVTFLGIRFHRKFDCRSLEQLRTEVEAWINRPLFRLLGKI